MRDENRVGAAERSGVTLLARAGSSRLSSLDSRMPENRTECNVRILAGRVFRDSG